MAHYGSPGNPNLRDLPRAKQSPVDTFRVKGAANMIREQVKTAGNIMSDDLPSDRALAERFRPVFARIAEGAVQRDVDREPFRLEATTHSARDLLLVLHDQHAHSPYRRTQDLKDP